MDMQRMREEFQRIKLQFDEDLLQRQRQTAEEYLKLEERVKDTIDKKVVLNNCVCKTPIIKLFF
jgi:hypothetical protein